MADSERLNALGRRYSLGILEATECPRTVSDLCEELGIPPSTCYRRIEELRQHDLLEPFETAPEDAPRQPVTYRRTVDELCIDFETTDRGRSAHRMDVTYKIDDLWEDLVAASCN